MKSKIKFIQNGNVVNVIEFNEEQVKDVLGSKVYILSYNQDAGFFLTYVKDKFELPEKLYGSTFVRAERVLKSYNSSTKGIGVLCTGDKGSGKTLLTSKICNDSGLPVVIVNAPYTGGAFELFVNRLGECVLVFDEFGKTYRRTDDDAPQEGILSMLDGTTSNKRLILMTENEENLINDYIIGRSGRIRYHFAYSKLEEDVISQYCAESECGKEFIQEVLDFCRTSHSFSFDTLVTLVKEHKEYAEPLSEFLPFINVDGRNKSKTVYIVDRIVRSSDGKEVASFYENKAKEDYYSEDLIFNPREKSTDAVRFSLDVIDNFVSKQEGSLVLANDDFTVLLLVTTVSNNSYHPNAF